MAKVENGKMFDPEKMFWFFFRQTMFFKMVKVESWNISKAEKVE